MQKIINFLKDIIIIIFTANKINKTSEREKETL